MSDQGQQGFTFDGKRDGGRHQSVSAPPSPEIVRSAHAAIDFEAISKKLLIPHEAVRDPIHGDIWITLLERLLMDTQTFQRLRGIMQLGPVALVYPGAVHTRFAHSLGTLHVAQQFVEICNRNADIGNKGMPRSHALKVGPYENLLVRLYALLHDLAHIPFGHTLAHEGNLMADEWGDEKRAKRFFGPDSEIRDRIETALQKLRIDDQFTETLLDDLWKLLTHKSEDDPMSLEYPYIKDLVGNTVCADLWDYLQRDMYFCGLRERSGDRFINYLAVLPLKQVTGSYADPENEVFKVCPGERGRGVLLAFRYERDREDVDKLNFVEKQDVLSEAIDMLRRRYSLAEKVYFHRTKIAASSMLISAVGCSKVFKDQPKTFYDMTQPEFLKSLVEDKHPRCASLASAYYRRELLKPIYRIKYRPEQEHDEESRHLWQAVYGQFRDYGKRLEMESSLEREFELSPGTVSIYCPDRTMNLKQFEVLVAIHPGPEVKVKPLRHILDESRRKEMDAIRERFFSLWTLEVFVKPNELDPTHYSDPRVQEFCGACESPDYFGLPNDIKELRGKSHDRLRFAADAVVKRWQAEHEGTPVSHNVYQELVCGDHRDPKGPLRDYLYTRLCGLMERDKT